MPQMSSLEITSRLLDRLSLNVYDFFVVNFANPDMVAHTGNIDASIKACEYVDSCIGKIVSTVLAKNGTCLITADHGNVEEMLTKTGGVDTEHSKFPVPLIIANRHMMGKNTLLPTGKLGDIAPTILSVMGIPIPKKMTGTNLVKNIF
jgi:2,3-bisphosphoglycerate-independent phosphoglycerate mutase